MSLTLGKLKIGSVTKDCKGDRGGWKRDELVKEAKKRGIEIHSKMTKSDLCELLLRKEAPVISPRVKLGEVKTWQQFQTYASQQSPHWGRKKRSEKWKELKGVPSPRTEKKRPAKIAVEEEAPQESEEPTSPLTPKLEEVRATLEAVPRSEIKGDVDTIKSAGPQLLRRVSLQVKSKSKSPKKLAEDVGDIKTAYDNLKSSVAEVKESVEEAAVKLAEVRESLARQKKAEKKLASKVSSDERALASAEEFKKAGLRAKLAKDRALLERRRKAIERREGEIASLEALLRETRQTLAKGEDALKKVEQA